MITPETALTLANMAQDFCAILLWGGLAYLAFLVPHPLSTQLYGTLRPWSQVLALVLFCATLGLMPIEAANLGNGWLDALNTNTLHDILFESSVGLPWFGQFAATLALLLAAFLASQRLKVLASLAGICLATRAWIGHAVMLDGSAGTMLHLSYLIHVLAAGAWVGALAPVYLLTRQMTQPPGKQQATALHRFSTAGHGAVILTILSGFLNAILIRGRFFPIFTSAYDGLLILKVALVAAMVTVALCNRYVLVPQLRENQHAALSLRLLTGGEFVLAMLVLIVVNLFSTMDPH